MANPIHFEKICLASQSPRRQELLQQIGVSFNVIPANIDEQRLSDEKPLDYVQRITLAKASAVWNLPDYPRDCPVLASDTAVVVDEKVLGKPSDKSEGKAMLHEMSGRSHKVITGVALVFQERKSYQVCVSDVTFRTLSEADIEHYWLTGEGSDKAGCYAIQGYAASFIEKMQGSFSAVMGLPLFETCALLDQWGIAYWPHKAGLPQSSSI